MGRLLVILTLLSVVCASAATKAKKPFNLFQLPSEEECLQLGCNVHPADKVKASRAVTSIFEPARRSCCSRQGGVCGCAGGQSVCCDGTLNVACGCD